MMKTKTGTNKNLKINTNLFILSEFLFIYHIN